MEGEEEGTKEKLDKIIDLVKWVLAILIINTLFLLHEWIHM